MMNRKKITAALLAATCLLGGCSVVETPQTTLTEETVFDVENIRAQDDYYGYINGSYLYNMDVNPVTGSGGSFEQCQDIIMERLMGIVASVVAGDRSTYALGSNEQIIYDAYYQMLNSNVTMDSESVQRILSEIDVINGVSNIDELIDVYGELATDYGVIAYYDASVEVNLYNSEEYIPLIKISGLDDLEKVQTGGAYANSLKNSIAYNLRLAGVDRDEADRRADSIVRMQIDLASFTDFDVVNRLKTDEMGTEYTVFSIDEYNAEFTNGGTDYLCRMYGINPSHLTHIGVYDEGQVAFLDSYLVDDNLQVLKDIAIHSFLDVYGGYIPFDGPSNSTAPTEEAIATNLMMSFPEQLAGLYTEYYRDEATVNAVTAMTESIIDEYIVQVNNSYMTDEGKAAIIAKLEAMELYIGAPEAQEIDPSNASLLGEDVLDTIIIARQSYVQKFIDCIGAPINHEADGWAMSSFTVNACYNPRNNSINIPLGIMLPPFYDPTADTGVNYGGLGVVIGHEISHAFDSDGMNYDAHGIYNPDWIPMSDRVAFDERNEVIVEYFSAFTVNDVYHVDGELTLGENLADIGGLQCVLNILEGDASEQQKVFESYARVWASVTPVDDAIYYLEIDVHSPDRIRVNAVVALFDEFYEIYDVNASDDMFVASDHRIRRW